jgi:hemoglobin/transferrin/lactoferrin receptor protein
MPLSAQQNERPDSVLFNLDEIVVTATRTERAISTIPRPISVIAEREIGRFQANNFADLFRNLPGLEVTGVGANQTRPSIRGQRGQRILLLQDGIRLNNTRRQRNFGELPALVDVSQVEQIEVVRGPASVLYGSDAIGGVINVITRGPSEEGFSGNVSLRGATIGDQQRFAGRVSGRSGAFTYQLGASLRETGDYEAPAGDFGDITLASDVVVRDTGVDDQSFDVRLGYDFSDRVNVFGKFESYDADDAGFGFVRPEDFAPGETAPVIRYPEQSFRKFTGGLRAEDLGSSLADRVELLAYTQTNDRILEFNLGINPFPGASIDIERVGDTEVSTWGFRAEAQKLVADEVLLTYGVDGFRDRQEGTDRETTTLVGFGPPGLPPTVQVNDRPQIPTSEFFSAGAFLQAEVDLGDRVNLVGGVRGTQITAESFATPGLEDVATADQSDGTAVAALNALFEVTDGFSLIGAVGTAFRAPNLVERFFEGPLEQVDGFQQRNDDLQPERSFNYDLGARYRVGDLSVEGFYFRNEVSDGITGAPVLDAQGQPVERDGLPVFQNVNIDKLIFEGYELSAQLFLPAGLRLEAVYSELDSRNANDPDSPIGDSYSSNFNTTLGWTSSDNRFFAEYRIRNSGEQRDIDLGTNPLGAVIPGFTVQNLRFGGVVAEVAGTRHTVNFLVNNLTNELYAETTNAAFFRPEAARGLTVTYQVGF